MVTSREDNFVFNSSTRTENVKTRQDDRASSIHVSRSESTKLHPNGTVQDNVTIGKVLDPARGSTGGRGYPTFPKFFGDTSMFSSGLWLDAAEANKPRVFQEHIRSPFAGRCRHVDETVSCTEMLLGFQGVIFPPPEQPLNARQARDSISAIQGAVSSDTAV